ncbi:hypothetical protein FRC03_002510 [Tulasnella sp. 419]|nr:hypothetical protein FRC02_001486 [Tulasnella sp. 418]KAG8963826.1 hypothetical protein FRC03_002510 [Tulasnella sp. 419]
MATSMAAALAASLPATTAQTEAPVAPKASIPKTMAHAVDIEAEIPITRVQLDGLVATKIIKHSRESQPSTATGTLLGLDLEGTLEVSNSFPLPSRGGEDEDGGKTSSSRYQASMLRALHEVQGDDNIVGFYQSTSMGAFYRQSLLDTQATHHEKLRHGGIVLVHDVAQTARGNASFRAFQLSPAYLNARKSGKFHAQTLIDNSLTFREILVELPVVIRNSPLANAFLGSIGQSSPSPIAPNYSTLTLPPPTSTARSLESMIEALDAYRSEENNYAYLSRQIKREKERVELHIEKRKAENQQRIAQGLAPLPEEDVSRLFKVPQEPSRMEGMLLLGQIDGYAKDLESLSGLELVKMYAARAGSGV